MRRGWRWLLLLALGGALWHWARRRPRQALTDAEAAVYGDEAERMQDA